MRTRPTLPDSGVHIDNLLTMALLRRSRNRNSFPMVLMALLGGISFVLTFLSMFSPAYNMPVVLLVTAVSVFFFSWHANHAKGYHISLFGFMVVYLFLFLRYRMAAANGLVNLMNAIYQTIYQTDWLYFEPYTYFKDENSTTFLLCMLLLPIMGLLTYAVVRYHNFFLSMLVTFPFVEVGFFFGIAPQHTPAIGLFAFWCGMGAAQLASSGIFQRNGRAGFMRRRNTFFPVSGMRFLLPERAGITAAAAAAVLCLTADLLLGVMQYERPEKIKQMRTDFQYYAASVDWSDLSTLIPPFLRRQNGSSPQTEIELGRNDKQEFENTTVSSVVFSEKPQSNVYLRFRTAHVYERSIWSSLDAEVYDEAIIGDFTRYNCYPPEFLYYALQSYGGDSIEMTLYNAVDPLAQCVPYGYRKSGFVICKNDDIMQTTTGSYTIYGGMDYENLIMRSVFSEMTVGELLAQYEQEGKDYLAFLADSNPERTVQMPAGSSLASQYYGGSVFSQNAVKAALLSACGYTEFARANYLTLPDMPEMETIRSRYTDLLNGFDAEHASPQEIIYELELLRERLCSQVTYSLSPGKTPPYEDFASWFMLENQQGYCMHYATAGVLLARMAGIPARYCDGYLIETEQLSRTEDRGKNVYTAEILDSNAHAWCEVFIEGYGWIPFEFTYTYFTPPQFVTETEPVTEEMTEPASAAPTTTAGGTHTTVQTTTTETTTTELPPEEAETGSMLPLAVAAILGAITGGFVLARRMALRKRRALFTQADKQAAAGCAWRWLLTLMRACGADTQARTIEQLCEEAEKCTPYLSAERLEEALAVGMKLRYSPHGISEEELDILVRTAEALASGICQASGFSRRWRLKWFRHFI